MDYLISDLSRDSSQGHHFKILFGEKIHLEDATEELFRLLAFYQKTPEEKSMLDLTEKIGVINFGYGYGQIYVSPEIDELRESRKNPPKCDFYTARENNMDFEELKEIYSFLMRNSIE